MKTKYTLKKMREEAYKFVVEIETLYYQNWIGVLDKIDIAPVFNKYKHLFTRDAVLFIKKQKGKNKEDVRRLRHLLGCFMEYHMELKTRDIRSAPSEF